MGTKSKNIASICYSTYKDSGVEWLREIPSHWTTKRIKHLFTEIYERSFDGAEDLLSVSQYTGVTNKTERLEEGGMLTNAATLEGHKKVWVGDLVSNIMLAWNGSLGFSPFNGITSPAYSIYRLKTNDVNRYFHYLLRTELYKSEFKRNSSGVIESRLRLYTDDFFRIESILPPISEQTAIADFLDRKTALIDQAIDIKQQQIELLKERRQILIHKAVTRGLNPDVKVKDSGVEWIGVIPEGWEVKKLKNSTKIFRGKFTHRPRNDERLYNGKFPFFQTGDVAKAGKFLSNYKQTLNDFGLRVSTLFPKGTIVITIAANIGDISILDIDACFPDSIVGFEPMNFVQRDFLYNSLLVMKEQFMSSTIKNTQMNLNVDRIGVNSIAIPPLIEQAQIIKYIELLTNRIAMTISLKKQEIEKLSEYKATLINSAVTGKIKVC